MSHDVTLERTLPSSLDSERAVLGAIILGDKAIFPAMEILTADDFYLEAHREIFRAMLALAEEESSVDHFTLREELRRRNKEEAAGGPAYLVTPTDGLPRALNVEHYARTVKEKATSRQLIQLSNEAMCRCYEGEERPAEILEKAESRIFQVASREIKGGFQPTRELADAAYKEIEEAAKHKRTKSDYPDPPPSPEEFGNFPEVPGNSRRFRGPPGNSRKNRTKPNRT
jgi:replicative DNA helicase